MACSCESLVDSGLYAGEFGVGHADEVEEVECAVYAGDVEVCLFSIRFIHVRRYECM